MHFISAERAVLTMLATRPQTASRPAMIEFGERKGEEVVVYDNDFG